VGSGSSWVATEAYRREGWWGQREREEGEWEERERESTKSPCWRSLYAGTTPSHLIFLHPACVFHSKIIVQTRKRHPDAANAFPIAVGESFPTYATKTACGSNTSPIDASASPPRNAATQSPSVNAELTILLRPCNAIRINPLRSHHWILCF
jgi:hypothetical protein